MERRNSVDDEAGVSAIEGKRVEVEGQVVGEGGVCVFSIGKVWGSLDIKHRGSVLGAGMTWVPEDQVQVAVPVERTDHLLTIEQTAEVFKDLLGTLMPGIEVFVTAINEAANPKKEELDDF